MGEIEVHMTSPSHLVAVLFVLPFIWSCAKAPLPDADNMEDTIQNKEIIPIYTLKGICQLSSFGAAPFSSNAQGMDIFNDRFLFQTGTEDRTIHIVDLENKKAIGSLAFSVPNNEGAHMNNINCGLKLSEIDQFPLLYISQTGGSHSCFVIRINNDAQTYELIQTIKYIGKNHYLKNSPYDWFIDLENNLLYSYGYYNGNRLIREIMKFNLPPITSSTIMYSDDDIIDSFVLENQSIYQGSKIIDGLLYTPVGAGSALYPSRLIIIDLKKKEVYDDIPLACGEPESIGRYKSGAIIGTGGWDPFYYFISLTE